MIINFSDDTFIIHPVFEGCKTNRTVLIFYNYKSIYPTPRDPASGATCSLSTAR
jgi:hypothetical protein